MTKVTLKWELESKNFDELKSTLSTDSQQRLGNNHCGLCILSSGPMCIHRAVCRAKSHNEIFINNKIEEIKS